MVRNTIFTKALFAALLATPVVAQETSRGCFSRDYSADHLTSHPAQVVDDITLRVYDDDYGNVLAEMLVRTANQGHVAKTGQGGQSFYQFLLCWDNGGLGGCAVECDGGNFEVEIDDGKMLQFETDRLLVGNTDDCGGVVDLAEVPGQPVSYRLYRTDDLACDF